MRNDGEVADVFDGRGHGARVLASGGRRVQGGKLAVPAGKTVALCARNKLIPLMAGLDPAIQNHMRGARNLDARVKPAHEGFYIWCAPHHA
jgi:hypothetical protein